MKLIQSFWSKPTITGREGVNQRKTGGWLNVKYQYISYALSCLLAKKYAGPVHLYTDSYGKTLLIDLLKLPFETVSTNLDVLDDCPSDLWALGKILTYQLQNEPFLHFDNDVFLWDRFERLSDSELIAQHLETGMDYYHSIVMDSIKNNFAMPSFITTSSNKKERAYNAGILGGKNLDFFCRYCEAALSFVDENFKKIHLLKDIGLVNVLFEQLFFYKLSMQENIPVTCLEEVDIPDEHLTSFGYVPTQKKYIHLFGGKFKKNHIKIANMEMMLKMEFPDYYYRISKLVKDQII